MSRRFLGVAALTAVAFAAVPAHATESRIRSLGGGFKHITILDDRNIFELPAEIVKYGTWSSIEIGANPLNPDDNGYSSFAIHYNFTPTVVLGVYGTNEAETAVREPDALRGMMKALGLGQTANQAAAGNAPGANPNHKATLFFGADLGSARLGAKLGIWADKNQTRGEDDKELTNHGPLVFDIGLGAGFAMGASDLDLALDFRYGSPTDYNQDGDAAKEASKNSEFDIGLLARLTVPFSGPHELVPFLRADFDISSGQLTADGSPKLSGFGFGLVAGSDIRLNLGDHIIVQPGAGLGGRYASVTTTPDGAPETVKSKGDFFLFYNLAVDVRVAEWCDIRFGGGQTLHWYGDESTDDGKKQGGTSTSVVDHNVATGVGFNLPAGVTIDIQVSKNWWKSGPYLVTGATADGFGLNAAISKDW